MKKNLPFRDGLAPVNHMLSASVGEVVRAFPLRLLETFNEYAIYARFLLFVLLDSLNPGCVLDSRPNRSYQDPHANINIWCARRIVICGCEDSAAEYWPKGVLQGFWNHCHA